MTQIPHQLAEEFPDHLEELRRLETESSQFKEVVKAYDAVNGEVYQIEAEIEPASDVVLEDLKKKRLVLMDQITAMIHSI